MTTKTVSAGILLFDENDNILVCQATGSHGYDIPKGRVDEGETFIQAAVRECAEETGIQIVNPSQLIELGMHKYLAKKDLYLFAARIDQVPVKDLKCRSYFFSERHNATVPEIIGFKWISYKEIEKYCFRTLGVILTQIVPHIPLKKEPIEVIIQKDA